MTRVSTFLADHPKKNCGKLSSNWVHQDQEISHFLSAEVKVKGKKKTTREMASLNKLSIFGFLAMLAVAIADIENTEEALERINSINPVRERNIRPFKLFTKKEETC